MRKIYRTIHRRGTPIPKCLPTTKQASRIERKKKDEFDINIGVELQTVLSSHAAIHIRIDHSVVYLREY